MAYGESNVTCPNVLQLPCKYNMKFRKMRLSIRMDWIGLSSVLGLYVPANTV